ncbi:hypothetical protein VK92_11310 [Burkholderia sp. LK4]|nr:hypothetical protein VL00_27460 [Burkholderia cepacia]KML38682.1 hypothetical protein VL13_20660 [Burkholderia lata]KMN60434.1 hypothetical protein VK92_11310 [Burkholderia sp. LK4]
MPIPISPAATAGANAPRVIPHSRISTGIAKPINWPSKPSSTIASAASSSAPARSTRCPCAKSSPCACSPRSGAATAFLPQPAGKRLEKLVALTREER